MIPPIFPVCSADAGVAAVLGAGLDCRLYPFGEAESGLASYATWQHIGGAPGNYIDTTPDIDRFALQIDCWGPDNATVIGIATALRDAIEPHAHITRWGGSERDGETRRYRFSFDVDWWLGR